MRYGVCVVLCQTYSADPAITYAAHRKAWELKQLLHRDVSAGNILILRYTNKNGRKRAIGVLIDWDLCKSKEYLETVLRPGRTVCCIEHDI